MTPAISTAPPDSCEIARRAIEQRRAVLGPCLAAMGFSEHGAPPPELPDPLLFCGEEVPLESWERDLLLGQAIGDASILLAHFAEAIAFRALSQSRLRSLAQGPPDPREPESTTPAMIEETAIGRALQQEVQRDIDRLVSKGEMGDAKRLTGFRRKIDQSLAQLEQRIGPRSWEEALARSVELLTPRDAGQAERKRVPPPVETGLTLEDLHALEEKLDEAIVAARPEPSAEELLEAGLCKQKGDAPAEGVADSIDRHVADPKRRLRLLVYLLIVSAVAYTVVALSSRDAETPPELGMEHFKQIEAVLDVKPKPPSLFVRVKASTWSALLTEEKKQLVEELGRIAGGQGYSGVQVKSSNGTNVGQWLRKTGTRLTVEPESGS